MSQQSTVLIENLENQGVLMMTWETAIKDRDVLDAFRQITAVLDVTAKPIDVIVKLDQDSRFSVHNTVVDLLMPYQHSMLREWLIVGSSGFAEAFMRLLPETSGWHNVRWFDSEAQAWAYKQLNRSDGLVM